MRIHLCARDLVATVALASGVVCADLTSGRTIEASDNATCAAKTINPVTHTLPQLCPTSSWIASHANETERTYDVSESTQPTCTEGSHGSQSAESHEEEAVDAVASPFMSFEDWKEMMLQKTGQDPQQLRGRKASTSGDRSPPDENGAAWGDEEEIELDFAEYASNADNQRDDSSPNGTASLEEAVRYDEVEGSTFRSKDAGKTCKERFSYSSFDAGATILKTGAATKNAKAILVENKDTYMLLECGRDNKFVIIELSDDILVDTIVIANFEFFSSMIHRFRLSVSDRYPVKAEKWRELGVFEARNSRDIQAFLVENPQIWAKYVRLEFLTYYGKEFYCPVSLVRVHGSRMLDSWKEGGGREDDVNDDDDLKTLPSEDHSQFTDSEDVSFGSDANDQPCEGPDLSQCTREMSSDVFALPMGTCPITTPDGVHATTTHGDRDGPGATTQAANVTSERHEAIAHGILSTSITHPAIAISSTSSSITQAKRETSFADSIAVPTADETPAPKSSSAAESKEGTTASAVDNSKSSSPQSPSLPPSRGTKSASPQGTKTAQPTANRVRPSGTGSAASASPTVQEGFFHSVMKRLQQVETNLTLSMQYIEDQSRHVQEAMQQIEQRQFQRIALSLETLNSTVLNELRIVRDQYEQLWHSTIIGLESQREQSERDVVALSTRLNLLADEVIFQKRMAIAQAVLLLSCLILVIFSRGVTLPYLNHPQLQQGSMTLETSAAIPRDSPNDSLSALNTQHASSARYMTPESLGGLHAASTSFKEPHPQNPDQESAEVTVSESPNFYYRGSTPPLQDTPRDSGLAEHDETPEVDALRPHRITSRHQQHTRKLLPALPEDPSSP